MCIADGVVNVKSTDPSFLFSKFKITAAKGLAE